MGWKPWRELRDRNDVAFVLVDLPAGIPALRARRGDQRVILIDRTLSPAERLAHLAHELVHDERGDSGHQPGLPERLRPLVAREEERVDQIVARRLIPTDELELFVRARTSVGPVSAQDVADEFEVPVPVARRALHNIRRAG